jgi:hypothetical protein
VSFNAINMSSNAIFYTGNVSEPLVALQDFSDSRSDHSFLAALCALCIMGAVLVAGLIQMNSSGTGAAYNDIPDSVDEAKKSEQTEDYV